MTPNLQQLAADILRKMAAENVGPDPAAQSLERSRIQSSPELSAALWRRVRAEAAEQMAKQKAARRPA